MNAIQILENDHREFKDLLKKMTESSPTALKTREKQVQKLSHLVEVHTKIEDKLIYPLILKKPSLENFIKELLEEHNTLDLLLKNLKITEVSDEYWVEKCTIVQKNLNYHIQNEEESLFPTLEKLLKEEELSNLGKQILEMKILIKP